MNEDNVNEKKDTETKEEKIERNHIKIIDQLYKDLKDAGPDVKFFLFADCPKGEIIALHGVSRVNAIGMAEIFKKRILDNDLNEEEKENSKEDFKEVLRKFLSMIEKSNMGKTEIH